MQVSSRYLRLDRMPRYGGERYRGNGNGNGNGGDDSGDSVLDLSSRESTHWTRNEATGPELFPGATEMAISLLNYPLPIPSLPLTVHAKQPAYTAPAPFNPYLGWREGSGLPSPGTSMHWFLGLYAQHLRDDTEALAALDALSLRVNNKQIGFSDLYAGVYRILYRTKMTDLLVDFQREVIPQAWRDAAMPWVHRAVEAEEDALAAARAAANNVQPPLARRKIIVLTSNKQAKPSKVLVLRLRKQALKNLASTGSSPFSTSIAAAQGHKRKKTPRNAYRANIGQLSGPATIHDGDTTKEDPTLHDEQEIEPDSPQIAPMRPVKRRRTNTKQDSTSSQNKGRKSIVESSGDDEDAEHESIDEEQETPAKKTPSRRQTVAPQTWAAPPQNTPTTRRTRMTRRTAAQEKPRKQTRGRKQDSSISTSSTVAGSLAEGTVAQSTTPSKPKRKYVVAGGDETDIGLAGAMALGHRIKK